MTGNMRVDQVFLCVALWVQRVAESYRVFRVLQRSAACCSSWHGDEAIQTSECCHVYGSLFAIASLREFLFVLECVYVCVCNYKNTPLELCGWVCVCHETSVRECMYVMQYSTSIHLQTIEVRVYTRASLLSLMSFMSLVSCIRVSCVYIHPPTDNRRKGICVRTHCTSATTPAGTAGITSVECGHMTMMISLTNRQFL